MSLNLPAYALYVCVCVCVCVCVVILGTSVGLGITPNDPIMQCCTVHFKVLN